MEALPRIAVVDIETSGLSTRRHRILQIAVAVVEDGVVATEWSSLVRLRWRFQRVGPRHVHGISRSMLRGAPEQTTVLRELAELVDGAVFAAHNAAFDWAFIERAAARAGVPVRPAGRLCTLAMSRRLDPDRERSHRLDDVIGRYGIVNDRPHDARHDARATAAVLPHLLAALDVRTAADLEPFYER